MLQSCQYNKLAATGVVKTGPCLLVGVIFHDTVANTFQVFDAVSATNLVFKAQLAAGTHQAIMFTEPIAFSAGIYYSATGTTHTATFLVA